ncbi:transcriptional regulator, Crp/Fnr family [Cyclobacterium qasimii M12-11B]|uniref:Transcriptional regulator, Crp/Fnr family n=1 Tax=Cyclobacterium qasimii M12-11B TaxID=641524 RepID=S7WNP0_9BACT|nr:transcriptional regulator, Crp/Fnr family [Cyclobacterium qasimii M12-11B]
MIAKENLSNYLPFFSDLRLLDALANEGKIMEIKSGETIIEPGQFIKMVPILLSGSIKVLRLDEEGKELLLYYIDPGETCALSLTCCSSNRASEIRAVAEEDSVLLSVPVGKHEKWTEEFKQWKDYVTDSYRIKFQELLKTLDAVAFKRMDERLMRYLVTKMKQLKTNELATTHQEIANELGTSREVISRLLKQLEKRNGSNWVEI